MDFQSGAEPGDGSAPPTPDEVAATFPVSLLTFAEQPALEEVAVSRWGETLNGKDVMAAATLSYTVWRNPDNRDDPANLVQLTDGLRAQLEYQPPWPLPDWLMQWRARMHYPLLWDAVRTTWRSGAENLRSVEELVVDHVDYIVMNQFSNALGRPAGPMPETGLPDGELFPEDFFPGGVIPAGILDPGARGGARRGIDLILDGVAVRGVRLDSDPHVLGLGIERADKILTVAVPREWLPLLRLEFATRPAKKVT